MCRHLEIMCRLLISSLPRLGPLFTRVDTLVSCVDTSFPDLLLSACVDTLKSCVDTFNSRINSLDTFFMCQHFKTHVSTLQFLIAHCPHVSTLQNACVDTSIPDCCILSSCVDTSRTCVDSLSVSGFHVSTTQEHVSTPLAHNTLHYFHWPFEH